MIKGIIAIDYDGTWTLDPIMWNVVCNILQNYGFLVIMVTERKVENRIKDDTIPSLMQIIYTSKILKKEAALAAGYKVDIWIDNSPGSIEQCIKLTESKNENL